MLSQNLITGRKGEDIATQFLQNKGFTIVERNWRYKHWEVDIIAAHKKILHFVEVKTRTGLQYGYPETAIQKDKMQYMKNAASAYQYRNPKWKYIQFDAIAIVLSYETVKEISFIEDIYF